MITEIFMQLLKQEAANLLKVGSDRIKVELKQISFMDYQTETTKEVNGLFYIIDSFIPKAEDFSTRITIRNGISYNYHTFYPSGTNPDLSHSFKNLFCEHIMIQSDVIDASSPIVLYLSFEKF